jgi:hypothetical protein
VYIRESGSGRAGTFSCPPGGVHREIKSRAFGRIDRARASFYGGRLEAGAEWGYSYESNQAVSWGVRERKRG